MDEYCYVINWMKVYSSTHAAISLGFKTPIDSYSSIDFYYKYVYKDNITQKGTINKREPKVLVERIPIYKDFKYKIIEQVIHPTSNNTICMIKSDNGCTVIINEEGISKLTPEQYELNRLEYLINEHKNKYTIDTKDLKTIFPKELVKRLYDFNNNVLFGSNMVKGKVYYEYIDNIYTIDNIPIILNVGIHYDGIGNKDLPEDTKFVNYNELKLIFTNNLFK